MGDTRHATAAPAIAPDEPGETASRPEARANAIENRKSKPPPTMNTPMRATILAILLLLAAPTAALAQSLAAPAGKACGELVTIATHAPTTTRYALAAPEATRHWGDALRCSCSSVAAAISISTTRAARAR